MKAIVLTCDKYRVLADHMLHAYQQLWPDNPFEFIVPYQAYPHALKAKYGDKIRLIHTPREIMPTMDVLMEIFGDDEWIYWCIDDKYVEQIDAARAGKIHDWVLSIDDPLVRSVSFCRCRAALNPHMIETAHPWVTPDGQQLYEKMVDFQPWVHQFLRGRVLKTVFATFPRQDFVAKKMDDYYKLRPQVPGQKWLVTSESLVTLGESTTGGKLMPNCHASLLRWGFTPPAGFELSDKPFLMGYPGELPPAPRQR